MDLDKTVTKLAQKLSWLIAAVLVLLPFHAVFTTWGGSNFNHLDLWRIWKEILFFLMIPPAVWLIWRSTGLRKSLRESRVVRLFVLYVLLHIVLGTWALAQHQVNVAALAYAFIVNLRFVAFYILCVAVASQHEYLRRHWHKILLFPAAVVLVFGLAQKLFLPYDFLRHLGYGKDTIPAYQTVDSDLHYLRIQSTLRGANPLGAYLVLVIAALGVCLRRNLKTFGVFLAGAFVVLFYSYSRSAKIGVAIALSLLAWWAVRRKISGRRIIALALILVVLAGSGLYVFRDNQSAQNILFHTSDKSAAPRSSNADRLQSLKDGAADVIRQPLGRGPGSAGPASMRNQPYPPRIAENYYLQLGQEIGILGMVLFIAINLLVARELWIRRSDQLAKILLASLVGVTFVNLLSHAWTDDTLSYLWWGLAGVACAPILKSKRKENEKTKLSPA